MSASPRNLSVDKSWLYNLAATLPLNSRATESALANMGVLPNRADWRTWLMILSYGIGAALLLAGMIFFFAYNWENIHRFGRFAILGVSVIVSAGIAFYLGLEKFSGKLWLTAASVLTGILLATFGMVYQTGADSSKLFFSWAVLILPWVIAARFQPLWLIWFSLANGAIIRWILVAEPSFIHQFFYADTLLEMVMPIPILIMSILLIVREKTTLMHEQIEQGRWFPQLIALTLLGSLTTIPVLGLLGEINDGAWLFLFVMYFIVLGTMFYYYLKIYHDLIMLMWVAVSIIVVLTSGFVEMVITNDSFFDFDAGHVFLVGLFILIETAVAAKLLLTLFRKWKNEEYSS